MTKALNFQDCERKTPPQAVVINFFEDKPAGIQMRFSRGVDPRTLRKINYTVSLTPATGRGSWETAEDSGNIESVRQCDQPTGRLIEGIWVESGARTIMILEIGK